MTSTLVYDCINSVERNLGKKSPIFFDMVSADLRTH